MLDLMASGDRNPPLAELAAVPAALCVGVNGKPWVARSPEALGRGEEYLQRANAETLQDDPRFLRMEHALEVLCCIRTGNSEYQIESTCTKYYNQIQ
jgi:hypothetical protein